MGPGVTFEVGERAPELDDDGPATAAGGLECCDAVPVY